MSSSCVDICHTLSFKLAKSLNVDMHLCGKSAMEPPNQNQSY